MDRRFVKQANHVHTKDKLSGAEDRPNEGQQAAQAVGERRPLRILVAEDSEPDTQLLMHALRRGGEERTLRDEKRTTDLRAANLKLQNVIEERKRLENELLEIAENERRRIGFDLHDDLGQKLTGVSLMLKGLEQRLATEHH